MMDLISEASDPLGTYEIGATVTCGSSVGRTSEKLVLVAGGADLRLQHGY